MKKISLGEYKGRKLSEKLSKLVLPSWVFYPISGSVILYDLLWVILGAYTSAKLYGRINMIFWLIVSVQIIALYHKIKLAAYDYLEK